jgi:hypothetical protein
MKRGTYGGDVFAWVTSFGSSWMGSSTVLFGEPKIEIVVYSDRAVLCAPYWPRPPFICVMSKQTPRDSGFL